MLEENETIRVTPAMGWLPDYPDFRDYTIEKEDLSSRLKNLGEKDSLKKMAKKLGVEQPEIASIPKAVNLNAWCSEVENQLTIGSCTAHAGVGVMEYYERRAFGKHIDASRLFLYKITRNLLQWTGDTGAFLRTTMAAMVLFGVPPEEYWKYNVENFDKEPTAFCYSFAQNYQALQYVRLDPIGTPRDSLLKHIKSLLTAGIPSMFGFTVFSSILQSKKIEGKLLYRSKEKKFLVGMRLWQWDMTISSRLKMQLANQKPQVP